MIRYMIFILRIKHDIIVLNSYSLEKLSKGKYYLPEKKKILLDLMVLTIILKLYFTGKILYTVEKRTF